MKYTVVISSRSNPDRALNDLITEVNRMIEAGWKPLGGVSFSQWSLMTNSYHQAMVYEQESSAASETY